jgi:hypothetical protein
VIRAYMKAQLVPLSQAVVRLDGHYGNGAIVADLAGLAYVMRGKDYQLLDLEAVQMRLLAPPDVEITHPETGTQRALFDFPHLLVTAASEPRRVIVATHPASAKPARIGTTRDNVVYELFYTALPAPAFTAADIVGLYLHRGAFETVLSDEDQEQDPDRWCSHAAYGQEAWQILSQWVWNLRLELGHALHPTPMRTTEFAPAQAEPIVQPGSAARTDVSYQPPAWAVSRMGCIAGAQFTPQPDGTLRCPAGFPLYPKARRPERDGSLRVLYAARIGHCRPCPLREECQDYGTATKKPRRVSAVLWPLDTGASSPSPPSPLLASRPILWGDWGRRSHRRELVKLLGHQRVDVRLVQTSPPAQPPPVRHLSRAERAHWRLSWAQRLARNAASSASPSVSITLFGIPDAFATFLSLPSI